MQLMGIGGGVLKYSPCEEPCYYMLLQAMKICSKKNLLGEELHRAESKGVKSSASNDELRNRACVNGNKPEVKLSAK